MGVIKMARQKLEVLEIRVKGITCAPEVVDNSHFAWKEALSKHPVGIFGGVYSIGVSAKEIMAMNGVTGSDFRVKEVYHMVDHLEFLISYYTDAYRDYLDFLKIIPVYVNRDHNSCDKCVYAVFAKMIHP